MAAWIGVLLLVFVYNFWFARKQVYLNSQLAPNVAFSTWKLFMYIHMYVCICCRWIFVFRFACICSMYSCVCNRHLNFLWAFNARIYVYYMWLFLYFVIRYVWIYMCFYLMRWHLNFPLYCLVVRSRWIFKCFNEGSTAYLHRKWMTSFEFKYTNEAKPTKSLWC